MISRKPRPLDPGFESEKGTADPAVWQHLLDGFEDANIYQTWAYNEVTSGRRMEHVILRRDGEVRALALARIVRVPVVGAGLAYVRWGPIWRRRGQPAEQQVFRQALRALRNEFVCARGLTLRLLPVLFDTDPPAYSSILAEEGFEAAATGPQSRTILMDLSPEIHELREGMKSHWKRELKVGDKNALRIVEGTGVELFDSFIGMYREMVSRKRFVEPNDINQFREIQRRLPEPQRMTVLLAYAGADLCAGSIYSAIGNTAIYLFGATSNAGMKSRGSYVLQWRIVEQLKRKGIGFYDLNGINPEKNPGTYKFKSDLSGVNGREVCFLGRFETHASRSTHKFVQLGETLRDGIRSLRLREKAAGLLGSDAKAAS